MKRIALLATTVLLSAGVGNAAEVTSILTDSVQMKVNPQIVISTPMAESYTVSGNNMDVTTLGTVANNGAGSYNIHNPITSFQFAETYQPSGEVQTQTQSAGLPDKMTGSFNALSGFPTATPGGPGSEAIIQRSSELTVSP